MLRQASVIAAAKLYVRPLHIMICAVLFMGYQYKPVEAQSCVRLLVTEDSTLSMFQTVRRVTGLPKRMYQRIVQAALERK